MDESVKENLKSLVCVKKFSKIQFADEMAGNSSHKLDTLISKDFLVRISYFLMERKWWRPW
jgi:hypothetical protein